ncbi:MAG: ankyrin repeat domain-containing protein [Bacteroidales bacterium]|nr:ankyrin repeat domain-containing protein [Bacteroidales bacterium]
MSENNEISIGRLRFAIKKKKNNEVISILNKYGVNAYYQDLGSALSIACMTENWEVAKYCIKNGADVNLPDSEGDTPLHDACLHDNLEIVKLLIEHGAEVNVANKFDKRPIAQAISRNPINLELIEYLLIHGADSHIQEKYALNDPRRTTFTAYDYAKHEIKDKKLMELLDRYKK